MIKPFELTCLMRDFSLRQGTRKALRIRLSKQDLFHGCISRWAHKLASLQPTHPFAHILDSREIIAARPQSFLIHHLAAQNSIRETICIAIVLNARKCKTVNHDIRSGIVAFCNHQPQQFSNGKHRLTSPAIQHACTTDHIFASYAYLLIEI